MNCRIMKKKREDRERVAYTLTRCKMCGTVKKREFRKGDTLFVDMQEVCTSCNSKKTMRIEKIFGELVDG